LQLAIAAQFRHPGQAASARSWRVNLPSCMT
jgi:hypothetical protein